MCTKTFECLFRYICTVLKYEITNYVQGFNTASIILKYINLTTKAREKNNLLRDDASEREHFRSEVVVISDVTK